MAHRVPLLLQLVRELPAITVRTATHPPPSCVQPSCLLQACRGISSGTPTLVQAQAQQPQQPQQEQPGQQEQASTSQQQGQQAGGVDPEELKKRAYGAFKSGYDGFRSTMGSATSGHDGQSILQSMAHEVRGVFSPTIAIHSATRKYTGPVMQAGDGSAALAIVEQHKTAWQKLQERVMSSSWMPGSAKVTDSTAFKRGQQMVDDLKEKYETSDHPMVHKVDEMKGRIMTGTDTSRAMREVRTRDITFEINSFVRSIKMDAPIVVKAFLLHDMETLKLHMGPEMLERLAGIFKHDADKGLYEDATILHVSDVEMVEVRMMDGDPFVVAQFHCQQLKCTRDKFGNVVDGSTNTIQRVHYFWGLQQEKEVVITADGQLLPPRWAIKDMMWQAQLALV
mmetsp:Transcript_17311/g.29562  ORF Transcript_17311/g.29562 Transcript_17311/m.29562 type:complete len:395 (+) Transcript_17311:46-1230(+)|eukprot:CAMPEP_0119106604 /NCGR_PEP_ID=MMETSP1180-20130426/5193_1 /TAXON_ID=3052 ORGANISM="Chlamydomonas cf sp, Strain CCMP681" /NCGR_SAMPLE_ID=MMETSP1180 /ASSEMBLY_ACC=CAM_ASM_000741 /LENGTH=394 /DNA_ID=CAMNT_0007091969 /DNA_START=43 /DNA_END=1227 /DNA_ORIENTATION=+